MSDTNTLQELINKRAEKKLDKDLMALSDFISANPLIYDNGNGCPLVRYKAKASGEDAWKDSTLLTMLKFSKISYSDYCSGSQFMKDLREFHLPKYIKAETDLFMQKFDELTHDVAGLIMDKD